jgi:hypothetical protein
MLWRGLMPRLALTLRSMGALRTGQMSRPGRGRPPAPNARCWPMPWSTLKGVSDTAPRRLGYAAGAAWVALTAVGLGLYLLSVEAASSLLEGNVANNAALAVPLGVMAAVLTAGGPPA